MFDMSKMIVDLEAKVKEIKEKAARQSNKPQAEISVNKSKKGCFSGCAQTLPEHGDDVFFCISTRPGS